jgi:hypothetical protein
MNQLSERYLEDFAVGQTFGSGRLRIDGERAVAFAAEFEARAGACREHDRTASEGTSVRSSRHGRRRDWPQPHRLRRTRSHRPPMKMKMDSGTTTAAAEGPWLYYHPASWQVG